ncbi:MAG: DUF2442 domain-containing protein [Fusobacteriaceae bacterium]|jgi:hypothetical protein|nr:DUF2442 domain-containing protein [Fusobacteriaceae bacterium]
MQEYLYGAEPLGPRVSEVRAIDGYKLYITFTNGEKRLFDAESLLRFPVFKPLRNRALFQAVFVANGTIEWPQGIDYCPDTLYLESVPVEGDA